MIILTDDDQPGANEVTIYGITPTADENSIKVEGRGSATITDLMVELVLNRDRYEDVYPSDSGDEDEDEEPRSDEEPDDIKTLKDEIKAVDRKVQQTEEAKASATSRLRILELYGESVAKDHPDNIVDCISTYEEERKKAFNIFHSCEKDITDLKKRGMQTRKKVQKLESKVLKAKAKASRAEEKQKEHEEREREKKKQAKRQLKLDRVKFWPKKVYKVIVSIDGVAELTPASSRRGSVSSIGKHSDESSNISLSLSYITNAASWSPRYDLSLNTPSNSGTILYRAEYSNATSEIWRDAKVVLSTSETSFQGLGEPIPQMQPWHIDLSKSGFGNTGPNSALYSNHEQSYKHVNPSSITAKPNVPRETLFGLETLAAPMQQMLNEQQTHQIHMLNRQRQGGNKQHANNNFASNWSSVAQGRLDAPPYQAQQLLQQPQQQAQAFSLANYGQASGGGLFGSQQNAVSRSAAPPPAPTGFGALPATSLTEVGNELQSQGFGGDGDTLMPEMPSLDILESSWSESGMTANYDVPGLRTIKPSFTLRRHRIASVNLKEIHLSHLIVPKLRAAAFLKARIRNNSSVTLLRGPVGVTLDGSFLGNTSLPRSSSGEAFSLNLGVDPAVTISYAKPTVRKSESGILNKEKSNVYLRTCTITNTKSNRLIEGLYLDQVPVSNDEKLKVDVIQPSGLRREGDSARSGKGVAPFGKEDSKWGKATAIFKKAGEVCVDFKIEGGKSVKFTVEYETRHPSQDIVVSL